MTPDENRWHIWERNRRMKRSVYLALGLLSLSVFVLFPIIAGVFA